MRRAAAAVVGLLALACGGEDRPAAGRTPEETFAAMRAATLAKDWDALYELCAPSERADAEKRWERLRDGSAGRALVLRFAPEVGRTPDEVKAMSLRELFVARNQARAEAPGSPMLEMARTAELAGVDPQESGVVMVKFRTGDREQDLPMREEDGRWYLYATLSAMLE